MALLTIVVPTHERARYAIPTLRSLLQTTGPESEIVVSDTSAIDEITPALRGEPGWHRITLVRPGRPLSVIDNFKVGLSHARGEYLLFIGDDDFVSPAIVKLLQWASSLGIDAIKPSYPALFFWPDFLHKRRHDFYAGSLHMQAFTGRVTRYHAPISLQNAADDLGGGLGEMPRVYAGIVARHVVERVVRRYGDLFGGVSPDIFSAALIACEVKSCIRVDYPLVILGASGASTAGLSALGQHVGELRENAHIAAFKNLVWNPVVPEFYSVPTVWGFTLLEALNRVHPPVEVKLGRLYARCLFYHRHYWSHTRTSMGTWVGKVGYPTAAKQLASGCISELNWIVHKVHSLATNRLFPGRTTVIRDLPDSLSANRAMSSLLESKGQLLTLPDWQAPTAVEQQGACAARPLLSIILPSRNRQTYLLSVLSTLLEVTQAELVVSDNSDQPVSAEALDRLQAGDRLVYRHHHEHLSVVENFERGLHLATGEYLLFLGDDDCVGPGIEALVRKAKAEGIESLISYQKRFIANYYWPGVKSKYFDDGYAGKLFLNRFSSALHRLDAHAETQRAANNPGAGLGSMPRAYHGIVSRALVNRILAKYGRLFGGVSPDIYSATLISHEVRTAFAVDYPFVIPGGSAPSTAGEGAARADVDKLDAREHIKRFGPNFVWDARIPSFYSPTTVWAYSQQMGLAALPGSRRELNYPRLYLKCLLYYPGKQQATFEAARYWLGGQSVWRLAPGMALGVLQEAWHLAARIWFRFIDRPRAYSGLADIGAAFHTLERTTPNWQWQRDENQPS